MLHWPNSAVSRNAIGRQVCWRLCQFYSTKHVTARVVGVLMHIEKKYILKMTQAICGIRQIGNTCFFLSMYPCNVAIPKGGMVLIAAPTTSSRTAITISPNQRGFPAACIWVKLKSCLYLTSNPALFKNHACFTLALGSQVYDRFDESHAYPTKWTAMVRQSMWLVPGQKPYVWEE